jgi:hypothetical protein
VREFGSAAVSIEQGWHAVAVAMFRTAKKAGMSGTSQARLENKSSFSQSFSSRERA